MTVIAPAAAAVFEIPGARFTGLASPRRGSCETCVWHVRIEAGSEPRFHKVTREEIFVALSGSAEVHLGGQVLDLVPGGAAIIPADTEFAIANSGDVPFEAVVAFPVGGEAVVAGEAPFVPPWAE
jgi:mannose-6-phosphate isomerase-like protein (cupin superfamily)